MHKMLILIETVISPSSFYKALSSHDTGEDDILDAGGLLEALRLYRWHISSFEEQVGRSQRRCSCIFYRIPLLKMEGLLQIVFTSFAQILNFLRIHYRPPVVKIKSLMHICGVL